jgi:hypothetical protein
MPATRTELTELTTGLGMLGRYEDPITAASARPPELTNIDEETWARLGAALKSSAHRHHALAAWANGRAFLRSEQALRGRPPLTVEWKGSHRAPGDEVVPVDLRVDHVYLVSCKYLSRILHNASPSHLFDHLLRGGPRATAADWYGEVAADAYQALYGAVRAALPRDSGLPPFAADLMAVHRLTLRTACTDALWPTAAYRQFAGAVGAASAVRWRRALTSKREQEAMLWRLLRIGSAPYFILGTANGRPLRLRITTPWDWRQAYELRRFDVWGDEAGQPVVRWSAEIRERDDGRVHGVAGHVEIRWSHGRFARPPEAKVYLDTSHHRVPGYVPLEGGG